MQQILPFVSTLCIAISAILVAIGWYHIRRKRIETHKRYMIAGAAFALLFFIIYVSKTVFVGSTKFGGPGELLPVYVIFLLFHITLATIAAVFGLVTLYFGFRKNYQKHRKIGPFTSVIWFVAATTGVTVYVLLYVLFPGGETSGLIDAIFG